MAALVPFEWKLENMEANCEFTKYTLIVIQLCVCVCVYFKELSKCYIWSNDLKKTKLETDLWLVS